MSTSTQTLLSENRSKVYGAQSGNKNTLQFLILIVIFLAIISGHNILREIGWDSRYNIYLIYSLWFLGVAVWLLSKQKILSNTLFVHRQYNWFFFLLFVIMIYNFSEKLSVKLTDQEPIVYFMFLVSIALVFYATRHRSFAIFDDGIIVDFNFKSWDQINGYQWTGKNKRKLKFDFQPPPWSAFCTYTLTEKDKQLIQPFLNKHLEEINEK